MTDRELTALFAGAADLNRRELRVGEHTIYIYAIDGLTSGGDIADFVLRPLLRDTRGGSLEELYRRALEQTVYNLVVSECRDLADGAAKLTQGFCLVLFGTRALAFEDKTGEKRSIAPPTVEATVKGAKDAFTETVRTNTSLVRRHLRSPKLAIWETALGEKTRTVVSLVHLPGVTDPKLVERMKTRLETLHPEEFLTPAAVEQAVTGGRATPFPLLQYTERPDRFAQGILEGRVGLLVDGLPLGYLAPVDLGLLMTSPEDRGRDYLSAMFLRLLRYGAMVLSLVLPGLYVAMAAFHPQMLPTALLLAIIESKQQVPFPTILEVLGLLLAFELVQEASLALPQSIGQSLSIIGGLVVGTAAVEARILSPAALIVVAAAGICGYAIPARALADALRLWRLVLAVLASFLGLFGLSLGGLCLLVHLAGLKSLEVPYLAPFARVRALEAVRLSRGPKP